MKVELLKPRKNITLEPKEDTQYIVIPKDETSVDIILNKKGVTVELLALFALKDSESVSLFTKSVHKVPHTTCTVSVKGALFDSSASNYIGKIIIEKPAQQTVSYLEDNILSIGNKTKNASQPILEIEADDVKASHGATTGRIDADQIYYLMSRGLSKQDAEKVVILGFFEALLSQVQDEEVKDKVRKKLNI